MYSILKIDIHRFMQLKEKQILIARNYY